MTIDRRLLAGALGLTIVLAACGGSSTPSSGAGTATNAPAATTGAATEAPAATEAAPTDAPTDGAGLPGQINDLAALLPEEVNGVKYERAGYNGDQLGALGAAAGLNSSDLDPILKENGKTITDVNFAIATSSSSTASGLIYAIQIEGVPATKFAGAMSQDLETMPKATIAGKSVYGEATGGFGVFVYPKDDILFLIVLVDEKTATAILEKLP